MLNSFQFKKSMRPTNVSVRQKDLHHYLHGLAVDSSDPQNVIVSASLGAWQAHNIENANSVVYRRSADGENWTNISKGLPESKGTIITILASNAILNGEFYALNNRGIFI